ncbi:MAG: 50S ribosomal protein L21e [DPANN group archaeon]|nr:50S ribosomal protein L21e [DPANN group archaeon]
MRRSRGYRSGTRRSLHKKACRNKITTTLKQFEIGHRVTIMPNPSVIKGMPHTRFKGKVGTVKESRGISYLVEIKDGNKTKFLLSRPEHIRTLKV